MTTIDRKFDKFLSPSILITVEHSGGKTAICLAELKNKKLKILDRYYPSNWNQSVVTKLIEDMGFDDAHDDMCLYMHPGLNPIWDIDHNNQQFKRKGMSSKVRSSWNTSRKYHIGIFSHSDAFLGYIEYANDPESDLTYDSDSSWSSDVPEVADKYRKMIINAGHWDNVVVLEISKDIKVIKVPDMRSKK